MSQPDHQPVDLWERALATLDEDLKGTLDFKNSTKHNILEKTLKTAEEKKQLCLRKRWKINRNGKEVVVRDVLEKIIRWLDHFKAVGDVAVQFDTTHAALPWAGVRFLLKVAMSDSHIFGSTIEGLETVSHLITRYAIFERVHMQRNTTAATELEPVLTKMYAEMLIFLARSKKYFQTPTARRMLKSTLTAFETDENQQLQKIAAAECNVSAIATLSDAEMLNCVRDLERPILRMADQAAIYATSLQDARYRQILDWLSVSRFLEHQQRHSESRIQGSGQWLLNHREYLEWQSSSASSTFLLHGMPGSGKSSLASAVIGSFIEQSSNQPSPAPLAYFYCSKNASEVDRINPKEIMRSIVRQLATNPSGRKTIHSTIVNEYERREEEAKVDGFDAPRLGLQDCIRLILEVTGPDPATIVLDAIDEVPPNSRHELLDALQQIVKDSASVVKLFLTSRDDDQILAILSSASKVRINAEENRWDMENFVRSRVSLAVSSRRLLSGDITSELQADLLQALIDGAGEIFQLAIWQIETLCEMRHETDIRQAMKHFSEDTLERMYSEILTRIRTAEAYSKKVALNAFSLLHCLCEPLSPSSFLAAVTQMDGNQATALQLPELLRICFNLIVLDSKMNVLRFAHTSVEEFLEAQPDFVSSKVNGLMATSCLNSCLYGSPVELDAGLCPTKHFYHYSTLYWAEHCKAAFMSDSNSELLQLLKQFMFEENEISLLFLGWLEDIGEYCKVLPRHHLLSRELSSAISQNPTPLFTVCVFGLAKILDQISQAPDFDCNQKNDLGQTGLYLACSSGQSNVVPTLLDLGADINASGGRHGNPLQASCFEGNIEITQLLLANGADPKSRGKFETALDASIEGNNEDIGLLVLERGFEIKEQSEYDRILQLASQAGHVQIVQQLQRMHGLSFGNSGSAKCKAIHTAISEGQISVVDRFLNKFPDLRKELPQDSIAIAALSGRNRMISLLLEHGLDIEHEGQFGTPLRAASLLGHESTVRLLLDSGAKNSGESSLGNALEGAAMNGHVSIANLLLQEGVDVNIRGGWSGTALQAAAYRGHLKLVMLLLDAGAMVYCRGFAKDAFHAAVEGGHEKIVRLLLDRGYKFQEPMMPPSMFPCQPKYKGLLRDASPDRGHIDRRGFNEPKTSMPDEIFFRGNDALEIAASNGHRHIVEQILNNLRVQISPAKIGDAFKQASRSGHEDVVKLFLSREHISPYLRGALNGAAFRGRLEVVKLLTTHLQQSQSVDGQIIESSVGAFCSDIEREILYPGCSGDHVSIFTTANDILKQHYSTAQMNPIYTTALYNTASNNSIEVMEILFNTTRFDSDTLLGAISRSSESGHIETLLCLLKKYPLDSSGHRVRGGNYLIDRFRFPLGKTREEGESFLMTLDFELNIAAMKGYFEVVKILFQEGADINVIFEEAVEDPAHPSEEGSENGHLESERPRTQQQNALQAAFSAFSDWRTLRSRRLHAYIDSDIADREATILFLLEHGASLNESDEDSESLLTSAIENCSDSVVELMINKGSSLIKSPAGRMLALRTAASREIGAASILKVLFQAGAHLEETESGQTSGDIGLKLVLEMTLQFFDSRNTRYFTHDGRFRQSRSIYDVLYNGPGAVVKTLLGMLPVEKTEDERYGLLLQMAVAIQYREYLDLLLQRGLDVNIQGYYYGTALQCAARFGNLELVQHLLRSGAEVNILKGQHGTALRAAVLGRHEEVVSLLLQHGADVNLRQASQSTESSMHILDLAIDSANEVIIKSLIAAGAAGPNVNETESHELPIFIAACRLGNLEIVQLFLDNNLDVPPTIVEFQYPRFFLGAPPKVNDEDKSEDANKVVQKIFKDSSEVRVKPRLTTRPNYYPYQDERASALHMACAAGYGDIVRALLDHGADLELEVEVGDKDCPIYAPQTPLQMAAYAGHLSVLQLLINAGANINHHNFHGTALSLASKKNNLEIVEELLNCGASIVDPSGHWNALAEASQYRCNQVVELLLDSLPENIEQYACTSALSAAALSKDDSIFQMLIAHGVPVSPSTLSQACAASLTVSALILLQEGVDIDGDNGEGGNSLQVAAFLQNEAAVDLLLNHGADVNKVSLKYGSPLQAALEGLSKSFLGAPPEHHADQDETWYHGFRHSRPSAEELSNCENIVRRLLDHGADIKTTPRMYGNPLHLASLIGSVSLVNLLLEKGADMDSVCDRFDTPLFAALEGNNDDIVHLLLRAGASVNHISSKHGTALHYACDLQNVTMVRILLDHGADANAVCGSHGSPLSAAITSNITYSWPDGRDNDPCQDVAEILLHEGNYVKVDEQDLLAVVKRIHKPQYGKEKPFGVDLLRICLEYDATLQATEPILVTAVQHLSSTGTDSLQLLLQRDGGLGVREAMIEATYDPEILKVLLSHRPICQITPKILTKMSENLRCSGDYPGPNSMLYRLLQLLVEHEKDLPITEDVMILFLDADHGRYASQRTQNSIEFLFERNPELKVTESMLKAARTVDHMKTLLKHAPDMRVTPEILETATGAAWRTPDATARELILLLLEHDETVKAPQSLLGTVFPSHEWSAETLNYLNILLDRGPDICLTAEILIRIIAAQSHDNDQTDERRVSEVKIGILKLFLKYDKRVQFTEDICTAIEREEKFDGGPELKALVYKLEDRETSRLDSA